MLVQEVYNMIYSNCSCNISQGYKMIYKYILALPLEGIGSFVAKGCNDLDITHPICFQKYVKFAENIYVNLDATIFVSRYVTIPISLT
jgi:hypothetical protein